MKIYRHTYGLTNGQIWSIGVRAENWKEASKEGSTHAREHARETHTHVEWQTTKYICKKQCVEFRP